eukprot:TRINITY_DN24044_c0_g1_i8.p1 TRINITY_DN24044_c0_g1~~TRINITY_DN24044_c0_g1_i8.p1  ORF type:complete len:331 (-),score=53.93 TRINITY_DN24044_c0_g1_i8:95-1087(-)
MVLRNCIWFVLFATICAENESAANHPAVRAPATTYRPKRSAELVQLNKLPLHTSGRYIVDIDGVRVKWACVNWAGAYSTKHVVGGLKQQPLANLSRLISELGFNCVRLPYSTQGFVENPAVAEEDLTANPQLKGLKFQDIFDKVVEALTGQGLMVIINNHLSVSGWCCDTSQDEGYWYVPKYDESKWIASLAGMADRYRANPLVVAFDIRNELHDNPQGVVTWGDGNPKTDWAAAAERAGNAILAKTPEKLIVVSAICFGLDLRPLMNYQVKLDLPNRVVYEVHNYIYSQMATELSSRMGISWENVSQQCAIMAAPLCLSRSCHVCRSPF